MTSFEVVTVRGAPIHTFEDRGKAVAYAQANADRYPGLRVEEVERMEKRRPIWSARHILVRAR